MFYIKIYIHYIYNFFPLIFYKAEKNKSLKSTVFGTIHAIF